MAASRAPATLFAAGDDAAGAGAETEAGGETAEEEAGGGAAEEAGTEAEAGAGVPPLAIAFCCACKVVETAGHPTPAPFKSCNVINAAVILAD